VHLVAVCECGAIAHETADHFAPPERVPCWVQCCACGRLVGARRLEWPDGFVWLLEAPFLAAPSAEAGEVHPDALRRRIYALLVTAMRSIQWLDSKLTGEELEGILEVIDRATGVRKEDRRGLSLSELQSTLRDLESAVDRLHEAMVGGTGARVSLPPSWT
jgi:hypothetical protein